MVIKEFETFVVANPPPRFGGRYFIFIKLVTDTGIVGYGEVYCATFSAATAAPILERKSTAKLFPSIIFGSTITQIFLYWSVMKHW